MFEKVHYVQINSQCANMLKSEAIVQKMAKLCRKAHRDYTF